MTFKRLFDIVFSAVALGVSCPFLAVACFAVWAQDGGSPLYRGIRVGRNGRDFRMLKLRSMRLESELAGGTSTALSDERVTPMGAVLRRWKLDELPQFWNVLKGDMSVVGPRPNTRRGGVDRYDEEEMRLLTVRPGITDLSSIVFSDEAAILDGSDDPDDRYDRAIRPWKSQLGLLYVDNGSLRLDAEIVCLTILSFISKRSALEGICRVLQRLNARPELIKICKRDNPLPERAQCGFTS